jgi:uncharacterized protein (TIGR02271 family)
MDDWREAHGARVVRSDGEEVGIVEDIDETAPPFLVVRTHKDRRRVRVPVTVVDQSLSTADRIVVPGDIDDFQTSGSSSAQAQESLTIPVVAEQAFANVREVEQGRAVIEKRVETVPHVATIDIGTDEVDVERVRLDQDVDQPPVVRQEGDTLIIPVVEEVLVVTKRYVVREEVRVTKRRVVHRETLRENLQREVVDVHEERDESTDDQ